MASAARIPDTMVACPISYGSIAFWQGRKADEYHTHKWTLYVRGPNHEDLSIILEKVVFSLHPSFAQPVRELTEPPFSVSEMGWGEFEASIRLFFRDPNEQPIDIIHLIKLYPGQSNQLNTKKPVVYEFYDEVVFTNPTNALYQRALQYLSPEARIAPTDPRISSDPLLEYYPIYDEQSDVERISRAQSLVLQEIDSAKARIIQLDAELQQLHAAARQAKS